MKPPFDLSTLPPFFHALRPVQPSGPPFRVAPMAAWQTPTAPARPPPRPLGGPPDE
ncbi:MAG: hypothetical protein H6739_14295 [Alphaproteobacteria bacterium]|nr:hypothetical protein [Alphaproteobacteria bacterium]